MISNKLTRENIPNVIVVVTAVGVAFETVLYLCNMPAVLALVTLIPVAWLVKQFKEFPDPCRLKVADEEIVTCDV